MTHGGDISGFDRRTARKGEHSENQKGWRWRPWVRSNWNRRSRRTARQDLAAARGGR